MTQISLTSPAAVTILLDRSKIFSVAPGISSYLTVAIPAESVAQAPTSPTDYGPYLADREVTLNLMLGTVVYEVKESAGGGAVSAASIVTALDEATPAELAEIQASVSRGATANTVFGIGNSIMRTQSPSRNGASFLEFCAIASNGAMRLLGQAGVNGDTTAMILGRIDADALTSPAARIIVSELTNDAIQNVAVAASRANVAAIIDKIQGAGKVCEWVAAPPKTSRNIRQYNAMAKAVCLLKGVRFYDPWDSSTADGVYIDSAHSIDGTHPTPMCGRKAGVRLWSMMSASYFGSPDLCSINADVDGMLTTNALFLTNTAGVPTGWAGAAGVTHSIEAVAAPGIGNWWKQTVSGIASARISSRSAIALPAGWVAGDVIRMSCRVRTVGFEANGSSNNVTYAGQGKLSAYIQMNWGGGGSLLLREIGGDIEGVYSVDGVLPATITNSSQLIVGIVATATASGEFSVAQLQLHNLSLAALL
jgi:lysophospholipase L1-like esterase